MAEIHVRSVAKPFDSVDLASQAVHVIARADAMGLIEDMTVDRIDLDSIRAMVERIVEVGLGREAHAALQAAREDMDPADLSEVFARLDAALEASPVPSREWHALGRVFGIDRLAGLVGVSPASARRYAAGRRRTPDDVAGRLHFLATVVGDLAGTYNDYGVRRWFDRTRTALDGRAPAELLRSGWSPDGEDARRVKELARSITSSPAT